VLLIFNGCIGLTLPYRHTVIKAPLKEKNPTSYIYDATAEQIKQAINNLDKKNSFGNLILKIKEYKFNYWDSLFNKPENYDDVILDNSNNSIGKSLLYFSEEKNEALDYYAKFHLHLTKLDTNKTSVEIFTYESEVHVGTTSGLGDPHGPKWVFEKVQLTTIEEYKILLKIGEALGVKDKMPELILPDKPKE
jgi:hypothetical protein